MEIIINNILTEDSSVSSSAVDCWHQGISFFLQGISFFPGDQFLFQGISWGEATANPGSHFLSWFDGNIGALEGITRSDFPGFGIFDIYHYLKLVCMVVIAQEPGSSPGGPE